MEKGGLACPCCLARAVVPAKAGLDKVYYCRSCKWWAFPKSSEPIEKAKIKDLRLANSNTKRLRDTLRKEDI